MTSSSDHARQRKPAPATGTRSPSAYERFIPREELGEVRAWEPGAIGPQRAAPSVQPPAPAPLQSWKAKLAAVRQEGYEEGYRDGLAALEGFKKTHAAQASERIGQLLSSFDQQLGALEGQMAETLARSAVMLARKVLRQELLSHPEIVAVVAREAATALSATARQVVVNVHPDDLTWVMEGAGEVLEARGARVQADPTVNRGGCRIDSDTAGVDATIDTRWARAAAALGHPQPWNPAATGDSASGAAQGVAQPSTPAGAARGPAS